MAHRQGECFIVHKVDYGIDTLFSVFGMNAIHRITMQTTRHAPSPVTLPFEVGLSFRPFVAYLKAQRETDLRNGGVYGL